MLSTSDPADGPRFEDIAVQRHDAVLEIRLDRPERLNPISARLGGTRDQIVEALQAGEDDAAIRCVLLTGAGEAFSAGGDLVGNTRRETPAEQSRFLETADAFHTRLREARVPVIAAVQGYCLGAALTLVASCDIVVAGDDARFGVPEGRMGLIGASSLVPVIGPQWAKFLIMTGELIDATTARDIGIVLTVEPRDELRERALDLARRLTRLPSEAVLLNKRAIDAVFEASGSAAGRTAARGFDAVTLSNSDRATAPDGRLFRDIVAAEGTSGLKRARSEQYESGWYRSPAG